MNRFKLFLTGFIVTCALFAGSQVLAQGTGITPVSSLLKRVGNVVTFLNSSWQLGDASNRIAAVYTNLLDASSVSLGGVIAGDQTVGGNQTVYGTDGVTARRFHATSTGEGLLVDGLSQLTGQVTTTAGLIPNTDATGYVGTSTRRYASVEAVTVSGTKMIVGAGSVSAPSLTLGDTDSGFYTVADNAVYLTLGGTRRFQWGPTNNISAYPLLPDANNLYDFGNPSNFFWRTGYFGTSLYTPALIVTSTGAGLTFHNTTDQVTNFEKGTLGWASNILRLQAKPGGTGSNRSLQMSAVNSSDSGTNVTMATTGVTIARTATTSINEKNLTVGGTTQSQTSGVTTNTSIETTFNQSGTAGYTLLGLASTETGTGSGVKRLISATVGGVERFSVDNAGLASSTGAVVSGILTAGTGNFTALNRGAFQVCTSDGTGCPAGGINYWARSGTELSTATPGDSLNLGGSVTSTGLYVSGSGTSTFQGLIAVQGGSGTSTMGNLSVSNIRAGNFYGGNLYGDHFYSTGDLSVGGALNPTSDTGGALGMAGLRWGSIAAQSAVFENLSATNTTLFGNMQPASGATVNLGSGSNRFNDGYFDNFHVSTSTVTGSFVYSGSMPASFVSGGISVSGNSSIMGTFSAGTSTLYNLSTMTTSTLQGLVLNGGVQISDDTQFLVSGKLVCLADGTNCSGGGGGGSDANWTFNPTGYNGEPTVSMVTSTAWLQTGAISIHTSTTDSLLTLQNDNSSKDVGITFRNSAGDGSVFSLSFTGPDSAEAPPNLGFFDIATSTTNFLFLPQNDGAPSPWMGFNNTSGNTEVYSGLVLQPFDFGFIGAPATYAPIISHNSATSSLNYADLATIGEEDLTITVAGAADGDDCQRGVPNTLASRAGEIYSCFVSAADTITVRRSCVAAAGCGNPSAAEVRASYWKH